MHQQEKVAREGGKTGARVTSCHQTLGRTHGSTVSLSRFLDVRPARFSPSVCRSSALDHAYLLLAHAPTLRLSLPCHRASRPARRYLSFTLPLSLSLDRASSLKRTTTTASPASEGWRQGDKDRGRHEEKQWFFFCSLFDSNSTHTPCHTASPLLLVHIATPRDTRAPEQETIVRGRRLMVGEE